MEHTYFEIKTAAASRAHLGPQITDTWFREIDVSAY